MKFLSSLQTFGFTRNEIKVVLILTSAFLIGLAIRFYKSSDRSQENQGQQFDYSIPDSIFLERSREPQRQGVGSSPKNTPSSKKPVININTATKKDLMKLPGIGEAYAERIISYRQDFGPFTSVEQLRRVKGIGKTRVERLRPYVTVN